MPKVYFSYIRVSTARQGQTGTSLDEQREAIERYAERGGLRIVREFEEKETAAKGGRAVFSRLLSSLRARQADGLIVHKIDRSARNLRDWSELGELIDRGIEVHFANENLDLESRGGRLSADIQAVVAADFIRNLREEVKKGFYGRIKQGLYPMPAPVGYLDKGAGLPKEPDPIQAPLIQKAFELYATGRWGLHALVEEMFSLGLRNKSGGKVTLNGMSRLLHNRFYTGLIEIKKSKELFNGQHKAIISTALFDRVQLALKDKRVKGGFRHDFVFRRLIECAECGSLLIGELQKYRVYYRCHTRTCRQTTIREDRIESALAASFQRITFTNKENQYLTKEIQRQYKLTSERIEAQRVHLGLRSKGLREKLSALTDAYLEGVVDKEMYIHKKNQLTLNEQGISHELTTLGGMRGDLRNHIEQILELANSAYESYKLALTQEKREMVKAVTSNLSFSEKKVLIKLKFPFQLIVNRAVVPDGRPSRKAARRLSKLVSQLFDYCASRKDEDEEEIRIQKPVEITPHRLKLAFRRANGSERLAA